MGRCFHALCRGELVRCESATVPPKDGELASPKKKEGTGEGNGRNTAPSLLQSLYVTFSQFKGPGPVVYATLWYQAARFAHATLRHASRLDAGQ